MNQYLNFSLEGKVALVTGASYGIGFAIASAFAEQGATICFNDINQELVDKGMAAYAAKGIKAHGYVCDVTDEPAVQAMVATIAKEVGTVDILVNNAGICKLFSFEEMTDDIRNLHFGININGVWNTTKICLSYMKKEEGSSIINMSSVTGPMVSDPGEVAYATSKAAVLGFTKSLAADLAKYSVRVNCIMPGYILTPMVNGMSEETDKENPREVIDSIASAIPLKRLGLPEEVGELASFLASSEASYITGQGIVIDGGSTLPETSSMGV